jgi:hypothetical protein
MTEKTGWPPGMLQDDDRKLSKWLANRIDSRKNAREAAQAAGELDDYPTATGVIAALSGLIGFLALFFVAGGIAWIVWQVLPILRAVS